MGHHNGNGNGNGYDDDDDNGPRSELNLALAFGGLAVAVSDSLNNNDSNVVGSHNNAFDELLDFEHLETSDQDGTWAAEAVKQNLEGGGNQFSNNQIQNIVDEDETEVCYNFENGAKGGSGGNGGGDSIPCDTPNAAFPEFNGHGGNGGNALGFSMVVAGAGSGAATGGSTNSATHNGSEIGSAASSSLAHLEAFNLNVFAGANQQVISLDATQSAEVCPCPENPNDSADGPSHNAAAAAHDGVAVAVDNVGNNNDNNEVLSFNDQFDDLLDMQCANVCDLDGVLSGQAVLQVLSGGGNQFENDQIQNIVDNDCVTSSYTFDNCCESPVAGGYGGIGYNDGLGGNGGAATGFTMSVTGGTAGSANGGNGNTVGFDGSDVGSATSASTAHLEAFNHNVILGANFQSESLTHTQTTTLGDHIDL